MTMPQYRKLHIKATESLDINDMPDDFTRLLWVMLPLGVDKEGRGLDNPSWIKSKIMPLRVDVTLEQISAAFEWFVNRGMIVRYEVQGRKYFYIPTFRLYQGDTSREGGSNFPAPNSAPTQDLLMSSSRVSQEQVESRSCLDADADADVEVDADADADAAGSGGFSADPLVQAWEQSTGLLVGNPELAVKALTEMRDAGVQPDDIRTAVAEMTRKGKNRWRGIYSVVQPAIIAHSNHAARASPSSASPGQYDINAELKRLGYVNATEERLKREHGT